MVSTQVTSTECQDLECSPLPDQNDHAGRGEGHHGAPITKGLPRETTPAGMRPPPKGRHDVHEQEDEPQVVAQGGTEGSTGEPHAHGEGEPVAQGSVDRGADDQDSHTDVAVALGLQEPLPGLEGAVAGQADQAVLQEHAGLDGEVVLLDEEGQDPGGEDPGQADGDQRECHEADHALYVQADADLVTRAVGLGAQGIEGGGHALEDDQAADVHRHAPDRSGGEVVGTEVAGDHDGDAEEAVLQEVGGDERQRVPEEQGQLGAPVGGAAVVDVVAGRGRGRAGRGRAVRQQGRALAGAVVAVVAIVAVHGGLL